MSVLHNVPGATQSDTNGREGDSTASRTKRGRTASGNAVEQAESHSSGTLTRVTANFTPRAIRALERVSAETGDSKTDVLNRAVMVYETFLEMMERGGNTVRVVYPDGTEERLRFLG